MATVTTTINIRTEGPQGAGKTGIIDHYIHQLAMTGSLASVARNDESDPLAHTATIIIRHATGE